MSKVPPMPSEAARELFHNTRRRILGVPAAELIWNRSFNVTDRKMLGNSFRQALELYPSAARMWAKVKRVNRSIAIIEVAETLNLLSKQDADWLRREGGELPSDPAEALQAAMERGDLVVYVRKHSLSWHSRDYEIKFEKHPQLWDFFVTVCRAAKQEEGVGWDAFGHAADLNYVTKAKSRLSKLPGFPLDLIDLFVPDGPKRQRLNLPAERIHFAE